MCLKNFPRGRFRWAHKTNLMPVCRNISPQLFRLGTIMFFPYSTAQLLQELPTSLLFLSYFFCRAEWGVVRTGGGCVRASQHLQHLNAKSDGLFFLLWRTYGSDDIICRSRRRRRPSIIARLVDHKKEARLRLISVFYADIWQIKYTHP